MTDGDIIDVDTQIVPTTPPTLSPTDELSTFELLQRQATLLANTQMVPRRYQGKPDEIMAAAMMGREVGFQPMQSLQLIHVVEGTPEISAEGMAVLIRRAGHSLTRTETEDSVTAHGRRRDNGDEDSFTFSMADANRAKLLNKDVWKKYPRSMMWARALSQLARQLFQDVIMGLSYVEGEISGADLELGEPLDPGWPVDVVDADGRTVTASGPTVYAGDEAVEAVLAVCQSFDADQKAAFMAEAQKRQRRNYSWSFKPEHRWTAKELDDAEAYARGLIGEEPFDLPKAGDPTMTLSEAWAAYVASDVRPEQLDEWVQAQGVDSSGLVYNEPEMAELVGSLTYSQYSEMLAWLAGLYDDIAPGDSDEG